MECNGKNFWGGRDKKIRADVDSSSAEDNKKIETYLAGAKSYFKDEEEFKAFEEKVKATVELKAISRVLLHELPKELQDTQQEYFQERQEYFQQRRQYFNKITPEEGERILREKEQNKIFPSKDGKEMIEVDQFLVERYLDFLDTRPLQNKISVDPSNISWLFFGLITFSFNPSA